MVGKTKYHSFCNVNSPDICSVSSWAIIVWNYSYKSQQDIKFRMTWNVYFKVSSSSISTYNFMFSIFFFIQLQNLRWLLVYIFKQKESICTFPFAHYLVQKLWYRQFLTSIHIYLHTYNKTSLQDKDTSMYSKNKK